MSNWEGDRAGRYVVKDRRSQGGKSGTYAYWLKGNRMGRHQVQGSGNIETKRYEWRKKDAGVNSSNQVKSNPPRLVQKGMVIREEGRAPGSIKGQSYVGKGKVVMEIDHSEDVASDCSRED